MGASLCIRARGVVAGREIGDTTHELRKVVEDGEEASGVRVVIVGAGEVGFNAARMLSSEGHDVVVVERDEALVERAAEQLDTLVIGGNGASPRVPREAGIKKTDLLVAATTSDEANIIACLAAKAQGVRRTVARIHDPDYYDPREPFTQDMLGIDYVIHTEQIAADEVRGALLLPGAVNVEKLRRGEDKRGRGDPEG